MPLASSVVRLFFTCSSLPPKNRPQRRELASSSVRIVRGGRLTHHFLFSPQAWRDEHARKYDESLGYVLPKCVRKNALLACVVLLAGGGRGRMKMGRPEPVATGPW